MSVRNDKVTVTVELDGKQAISSLGKLELSAKDIVTELKGMKKGTDEYIATSKKLDGVNADIKKLRTEMGTAGMTINQMKNYQRELNREMNNLTVGTERYNKLKKEVDQVNGALARTKSGVKSVADEAKNGGGFVTSFMGNLAAQGVQMGIELLKNFAVSSYEAAKETAQANAQLEASLKSTGGAAGLTKKDIDALAESLQNTVNIDDDVIKQNAAILLTFTNIKKGIFEQAMPAITDLAAKMDGDLKGATVQVGKALNDPIKGLTALSKVGVSFTEDQKKLIKTLVETGDSAGAQQIILNELNKEFGGSALAAAEAEGNIGKFNIKVGELQESVGGGLTNGLDALAGVGSTVIDFLIELGEESEPVVEVFSSLWDTVKNLWSSLVDLYEAIMPVTEGGNAANITMKVLATAFAIATQSAKGFYVGLTYAIDLMRILIDSGKQAANFFGKDFELDPTATMENANKKLAAGVKGMATTFVDIWTDSDKKVVEGGANVVAERTKQDQKVTAAQIKEADKRKKALEKEIEGLTKEWQKLGADVTKLQEDDYLETLSSFEKKIALSNQKYDELAQQAMAHEKRLMDLKVITQEQYNARLKEIEALRAADQKAIIDEDAKAHIDGIKKLQAEILQVQAANETDSALKAKLLKDLELQESNAFYDTLVTQAVQFGAETAVIEENRLKAIESINKKYVASSADADKKAKAEDLQRQQKIFEAKISLLNSFASLTGALNNLLATQGAKQTGFQKTLTLIQIALDTASAVASVIKGSAKSAGQTGPAYAITLAANIAAGTASVLNGIAQAKSVLSQAKEPSAPTFETKLTDTSGGGGGSKNPSKAFAKGGPTVKEGGYVPSYQVASFGEEGPEWVMPNWMLRSPRMANLVGVLEGVRMRGFAYGGFTDEPIKTGVAAAGGSANAPQDYTVQLINEIRALRGDVRAQQKILRAVVVLQDITDAEETIDDIKKESSI